MAGHKDSGHAECIRSGRNENTDYHCYDLREFGKYKESKKAGCLRQTGGDAGGGSECLVVKRRTIPCPPWQKVGALCAADYKWVQQEQVMQGKIIPCYTLKIRGGRDTYVKPDGSIGTAGKGPLIQNNKSATLGVSQDQTLFVPRGSVLNDQGGQTMSISHCKTTTLRAQDHGHPPVVLDERKS